MSCLEYTHIIPVFSQQEFLASIFLYGKKIIHPVIIYDGKLTKKK